MTVQLTARARASDGVADLQRLLDEWNALAPRAAAEANAARALVPRIVRHRDALFEANARAQADAPSDGDPAMIAHTDANQDAIKTCTTLLNEISAALGLTSIPA